jgi:hypothetical protein
MSHQSSSLRTGAFRDADAGGTIGKSQAHDGRRRHYCPEYSAKATPDSICIPAYVACTIFCIVLSTMFAVSREVGDPWDGVGSDDIHLSLREDIEEAVRAPPLTCDSSGAVTLSWGDQE